MKTIDIIIRAGRNLRQAKIRTLLTALAISVGAFTITLALAAGTGGRLYTDALIKNNGDMQSISVFAKNDTSASENTPKKYDDNAAPQSDGVLQESDIDQLKSIHGAAVVTPMYEIKSTYVAGPNNEKYQATTSIKVDKTGVDLVAGSLDDNQLKPGTVLVGEDYIKALGYKTAHDAIGKKIRLHVESAPTSMIPMPNTGKDIEFTIAAVDKKASTIMNYQSGIWVSPHDGEDIYRYQAPPSMPVQYYGATVQVADKSAISDVKAAIKDKGYEAFSIDDVQQVLFTFVNIVMGGAAGFGALAILASIFGIINTQYISVLERTQQIGLMKALGARRRDIGRLFRYEAAWVGFLGGSIGTLLALPVGFLNPLIADTLNLDAGTKLIVFSPIYSVILVVGLMLVAVIAGYFPSRKAAKLDPIEALRTE